MAQFRENISEFIDGVYIFESDLCGSCSRYNALLKSVKTKKKIFIIDCTEDFSYYISLGIDQMPETRVYESGVSVLSVKGVPTKKDMEILFDE
jgi:hypothetical protein